MNENQNLALDIYPRSGTGKNAAYKTRKQKLVPAVVYGPKLGAKDGHIGIPVSLDPKNFLSVYGVKGRTTLVDLAIKDGAPSELAGSKVLIKDLQTHSLKREVLHVDVFQLDLTQSVRMSVPLKFVGKAKGLVDGGILSIHSRKVAIKCLPTDIPHEIEVDVSDLGLNDSLHVHQLSEKLKDAKYEFIYENDFTLCAVVPPEEEKAATAVAADAAAPAAGAPAAGAAPAKAGAPAAAAAAPAAKAKK